MTDKFRLITRADLDGIACAVLLRDLGLVEDEIKFVHPKDMQHGLVTVTENDIVANLPYNQAAHLSFDHHASEGLRNEDRPKNLILDTSAPSAARVIYNHYGAAAFKHVSLALLDAADKIDSADVSRDDILDPKGWVLLGFIMDNRTGLGRYKKFRINNFQLMYALIDILAKNDDIEDILRQHDVAERVRMYAEHSKLARHQIIKCAEVKGSLVILDYRKEQELFTTNRFTVYALFPNATVSMHILPGEDGKNTVFAVGKSVLNRTSPIDIGALMLEYGGGGHKAVGTCQVDTAKAAQVKAELIEKLSKAG